MKNNFLSDKEQKNDLVKIIVTLLLFIAAFAVEHFCNISGAPARLLLYVVPWAIPGVEIIKEAFESIKNKNFPDENFLMAFASIGAFAVGEAPEAVMIVLLYTVGELFEDIAVGQSKNSVANLLNRSADKANVIRNGEIVTVNAEEVDIGEMIVVKNGEKVPLDGIIREGTSAFDVSALTGESVPSELGSGDTVLSSSLNTANAVTIEVIKRYTDSTSEVIRRTVENAVLQKPHVDRFITRFSRIYTPVVIAAALIIAFAVPLVFGQSLTEWVKRGLMLLVISCPCALAVSVPLSFFVGIGRAAGKGVLIKGCNIIETLADIKTAVFDKTGTLTKGKLRISGIFPTNVSEEYLIDIASSVEKYSSHPVAKAITEYRTCTRDITNVKEISGKGIIAELSGENVIVGNIKLMKENGFDVSSEGTTVHVAVGGKYIGYILVEDEIKGNAKNVIDTLRLLGIKKTVMLTGDSAFVAENVSRLLGIDDYYAELLPQEKSEKIKSLLSKKEKLLFVGDGINDAPALAAADVGIAMGSGGADIAIEVADAVITDDNIAKLPFVIKLAKRTMLTVKENIVFSLLVKVAVFVLSLFGITSLWFAVFADVGALMLSIINAVRK